MNRHTVTIYLENTGKDQLDVLSHVAAQEKHVLSHVAAQEKHLDWYSLRLRNAGGTDRILKLLGPRRESGPVKVVLRPGARIEHAIDVAAWAERPINGGTPLPAGAYQISATYDVPPAEGRWSGRLEAGPLVFGLAY